MRGQEGILMTRRQRIEIHFGDGRIEQADSLEQARTVVLAHPQEALELWLVSANDLGIASRIERLDTDEVSTRLAAAPRGSLAAARATRREVEPMSTCSAGTASSARPSGYQR
jgi:hypothetical protein